jgi:hypothetical protein
MGMDGPSPHQAETDTVRQESGGYPLNCPGRSEKNKRLLCLDCGTSTASSRRRGHGRNQPRRLAGDPVISSRMRPRAKKVSSHRGDASCVAKGCADSCHQPRSRLVNFRIGSMVEKVGVLKNWEKHTITKTACSQAGQSCERSKARLQVQFATCPNPLWVPGARGGSTGNIQAFAPVVALRHPGVVQQTPAFVVRRPS